MHTSIKHLSASVATITSTAKTLHCLRHGPSEMTSYMNLHRYGSPHQEPLRDPMIFDAPLTAEGRSQITSLQNQNLIAALEPKPEVVLTSPLTRCLQTAQLAFSNSNSKGNIIKIVAVPLLRERLMLSSEVGRSREVLSAEFPNIDFSLLPPQGDWWFPQVPGNADNIISEPKEVYIERMKELGKYLVEREEVCIAVVAHWGVLNYLTGLDLGLAALQSSKLLIPQTEL